MSAATDERVDAAIRNWAPRFVSQGVDYNDFQRTTATIAEWAEWLPGWERTADVHLRLAEEAEAGGHVRTAGEAFVRSALCLHFGKFLWFEDEERHWAATYRARDALIDAHRMLDPTAVRLEVPIPGGVAVGNLRRPAETGMHPLVVLLPGLDSTKEEFFNWEEVFLRRGMATFSFDGPGQGETGRNVPLRHDYEAALSPALDLLTSRPEIDAHRIGVAGVSLGGYYACRVAAYEPRVRAGVAVGGPYNFAECWPRLTSLTREAFRRHSRSGNDDEARSAAARFDLAGVAERIEQPLLIVFGKLDRLIPWEQAERVVREAPSSTFVLYEHGNHVCNNIPYLYRPLAADWLRERLARGSG